MAAAAAKRAPRIEPKMGKFVVDRAQAEEKSRVVSLFKEFTDRGKVPLPMIAPLVKELFKPVEKESKTLAAHLLSAAKDALSEKASKSCHAAALTAGDLTAWYFEVAWPMIIQSRQEIREAAELKKAAEAKAAAEMEEARRVQEAEETAKQAAAAAEAEAEAEAEAVRLADEGGVRVAANCKAAEGALDVAGSTQLTDAIKHTLRTPLDGSLAMPNMAMTGEILQATQIEQMQEQVQEDRQISEGAFHPEDKLTESPVEPVGWLSAKNVDVTESRRVIAFLAAHAQPASYPNHQASEMCIPPSDMHVVLSEALLPVRDEELLAGAPQPVGDCIGVPIGMVVKFWFDQVWPKRLVAMQKLSDGSSLEVDRVSDVMAPPANDSSQHLRWTGEG